MRKTVAFILAMLLMLSLTACGVTQELVAPEGEATPPPDAAAQVGKTTACTEAEISALISAGSLTLSTYRCKYLITHQASLPEDVLACLNEHLGEYRVYKLSGAAGELEADEEVTEDELNTIAAILQLHGYTEEMLISLTQGDAQALSADELAARVAQNAQYMVDGRTAYRMPEDGADFLPYFATFEPEVLDEALGVTLVSPREITDTNLDVSICRCALITNNSDKTVQLISAGDMTEADWEKVEGYDASLVIDWTGAIEAGPDEGEEGTRYAAMDLIPLGAATVLEPGESTVARYTYLGMEGEDYDFISRFSYYVTDGESTELLAGVVLNHVRPSEFTDDKCTITGTLYDEETGLPLPGIDIQTTRSGSNYVTTDENGRFSIDVSAFRFDATGNWARCSLFVNELANYSSGASQVDPAYAEECIIVEPHAGATMELTLALKSKPAQVNYTIQTEYDMKMQAYGVDVSSDVIVTSPFHTTFSEEYKIENSYLHVFDKTGELLFKKPLYGEMACCDISTDGTLVSTIVHGQNEGDRDTAVVWDINGNEVFSYQMPYKENPQLYVQPKDAGQGVYAKLLSTQISNDSTMLMVCAEEGAVKIVRISDGALICEFWTNNTLSHKQFWSADDKVVYTCASGDFRATEVATGKALWKKYIEATIMGWVMNDTCVVTSTKATGVGYLICTELATGKTLWTLDVGMRCSSMSLSHDGETLFWGTDVGGTNERVLFIDMETGTPLWGNVSGKQAAAFSANDKYVAVRSGGNLTLWTTTGEHLYGALIAEDNNSMSWGMYMSGDCKNIISFAGGSVVTEFGGVMYALTLDDDTPLE